MFLHRGEEWDAAPLRAEAGPVPATAAGVAVLLPRLALHSLQGNIALLEAEVKVDVVYVSMSNIVSYLLGRRLFKKNPPIFIACLN